jgi:hypothetical protein
LHGVSELRRYQDRTIGLLNCSLTHRTEALRQTFDRRRTDIPTEPPLALADAFARDPSKRQQWNAFFRKTGILETTPLLTEVIDDLASFLMPPAKAVARGKEFVLYWPEAGPWSAPSVQASCDAA